MKIDEGKALLLLSGVLAGIVISSFLLNTSFSPTTFLTYQQFQNLNTESNQLNIEVKGLYKELDELNQKLVKYDGSNEKSKSVVETIQEELKQASLFYGAVSVEGPGLKVIVDDNRKDSYIDESDLWNSITHNTDLYYLVNDLKNAGAEAISINGKRIINTTSITCEGPTIMVNGEYVVPPFEVLAIGDPDAMKFSFTLPESRFKELEFRGLQLIVEKKDKIVIDALNYKDDYKYIK
jgi:uncharacterized protein YlxW (UPF0749 family)